MAKTPNPSSIRRSPASQIDPFKGFSTIVAPHPQMKQSVTLTMIASAALTFSTLWAQDPVENGSRDEAGGAAPKKHVTAPQREWKDVQGRSISASVEGIEGGQVKFVRADGQRFVFPVKDLSESDQKLLADLYAAAPEETPPAEFTAWMSSTDFELKSDEKNKAGFYPLYVEANDKNEIRGLFEKRPKGLRFYYSCFAPEEALSKMDADVRAKEFTLVTLSFNRRTATYSAVWIKNEFL